MTRVLGVALVLILIGLGFLLAGIAILSIPMTPEIPDVEDDELGDLIADVEDYLRSGSL